MRILVTGASGLLGLNLALEAAKHHTVFGVVNSNPIITNAFTTHQADLLAPGTIERLLELTQPEWVIHCAALAILDACEADPVRAHQLNTEVPKKLAELVARGGARMLHVSTDAVFDGQRGDYDEQDKPNPLGIYAQTKLEGEHAVSRANPDAIIARVNLFGWSLKGTRSLAEFFYNNLSAKKTVLGFTNVLFCPLLANDIAPILLLMLEKKLSGLFHTVSSDCCSKFDFGVRIARRFEMDESLIVPASVEDAGLKTLRSPKLTLRTDKLAHALGETLPDISTGINHFYTLYQHGYPQYLWGLRTK